MRGNHDHRQVGLDFQNACEPFEPLPAGRFTRPEVHIEQYGVEVRLSQSLRNPGRIGQGLDAVKMPPEQQPPGGQDVLVVVNNQYPAGLRHGPQSSAKVSGIVQWVSASVQAVLSPWITILIKSNSYVLARDLLYQRTRKTAIKTRAKAMRACSRTGTDLRTPTIQSLFEDRHRPQLGRPIGTHTIPGISQFGIPIWDTH